MSKAIKLIVSGFESSGKSSITSKIQDVLVINFDQKEYSFEEAKELVLNALSILGDDYTKVLNEAFDNNWIDDEQLEKRAELLHKNTYGKYLTKILKK